MVRDRVRGHLRRLPGNPLGFALDVQDGISEHLKKGFESFAVASICDIVGAQEAFFRSIGASALAHRASISRISAGCALAPPSGLVPEFEPPPFPGGQCPGTRYLVDFISGSNQSGFAQSNAVGFGPFGGFALRPDPARPGWNQLWALMAPSIGEPAQILLQNFRTTDTGVSWTILGVSVLNGPNDCGNINDPAPVIYPPPNSLPPAPSPGQEIIPPGITTFDLDVNGTVVPVGLAYGSATINLNGNVNLNFGGIDVNISPDLGVDFGDGGDSNPDVDGFGGEPEPFPDIPDYGPRIDALGTEIENLQTSIESISEDVSVLETAIEVVRQLVNTEIDGIVEYVPCNGQVQTVPYSARGLAGLELLMRVTIDVITLLSAQYCPILPKDSCLGAFISSINIPSSEIDFFQDFAIPGGAKTVILSVDSPRSAYAVRRGSSGDNEDSQKRFAVVCFVAELTDGPLVGISEPSNQYYSVGAYPVPTCDAPVLIRVSLGANTTAKLEFYE